MSAVPIELPVKANEIAALADVLFQAADGAAVTEATRSRLAPRVHALGFESVVPYVASLQKDPALPSALYLAADGIAGGRLTPLLLHMTVASAPANSLFPEAILVGRMRPGGGREVVVNAIPFSATDRENIRRFVDNVDPAYRPIARGSHAAISIGSQRPEIAFPAAFDAFRTIRTTANHNLASVTIAEPGDLDTALWAAVRAGWREGFSAVAAPIFLPTEIEAVSQNLDIEVSLERTTAPTTPEELMVWLQWLKNNERPARLIAPNLSRDIAAIGATVPQLALVARQFNAMLSVDADRFEPELLRAISRAAMGRIHFRITPSPEDSRGGIAERIVSLAAQLRG